MKRPPFVAERLYTPKEVAAKFKVDPATVDRWERAGRIPASQVVRTPGGTRRYRAAYIDALIDGDTP